MYRRITPFLPVLLAWMGRPAGIACVAAVVVFPTLFSGFMLDDYLHLMTLEGDGYGAKPWDLFLFGTGDSETMDALIGASPYPWYTLPELKLHFFRPLSSASMWLDHTLFGPYAMLYHLHSLAWYILLVWGAALVYRRGFAGPAAGIATLLFVLDEGHLVPAVWWSNRNALVSAVPAIFGLAAHLRWREDGWRPGLPLSLLGYTLGLLGGETAIGILGYMVAYEVLGRDGKLASRLRGCAPGLMLAAVYLPCYKWAGYGVSGSGLYFDPVGEWRVFLTGAPGRLADLAGVQFFSLPVELAVVSGRIGAVIRIAALVTLAVLAVALRQTWRQLDPGERRSVAWLGAGALIASVPVLATFPSARLLTLPSLGACAVIAVVIHHGWRRAIPRTQAFVARAFVLLHLVLAPLAWLGVGIAIPVFMALSNDAFRTMEVNEQTSPRQSFFTFCAADPYTGFYPVVMRRALGFAPCGGWQTFSLAPYAHAVTRTGPNQFELSVLDGGEMLSTPFERLLRSEHYPYAPGDIVRLHGYRVTILETGTWGPRRIAVTFDQPLESPDYVFLAWKAGQLRPFSWPPVGETAKLPAGEGYFAWPHFKKRLGLL